MAVRVWLCLIVAIPVLSGAQELPVASPESVGMSSERLSRIGPFLSEYIERGDVPGFVVLVARRGSVVYHQAHGYRAQGADEPMPLDAVFEIASMTKPITVVSALMQMESGKFNMLDPISKYIPEFGGPKVQTDGGALLAAEREIQVHDLFTHTSGVDDPLSRVEKSGYATLQDYMQYLSKLPLKAQPGSEWIYGDSHDVLGYLIEVVSGQSLMDYWQQHLFDPLGMSDAHYWLPAEKEHRRAILLTDGVNDPQLRTRFAANAADKGTFAAGAFGLHTTAANYWIFCQMLLNEGEYLGQRYLSPATVRWISRNHTKNAELPQRFYDRGIDFGLGVAVLNNSITIPAPDGTYYWGGGGGTAFWIDPESELVAIVMGQSRKNGQAVRPHMLGLQQMIYGAIID